MIISILVWKVLYMLKSLAHRFWRSGRALFIVLCAERLFTGVMCEVRCIVGSRGHSPLGSRSNADSGRRAWGVTAVEHTAPPLWSLRRWTETQILMHVITDNTRALIILASTRDLWPAGRWPLRVWTADTGSGRGSRCAGYPVRTSRRGQRPAPENDPHLGVNRRSGSESDTLH